MILKITCPYDGCEKKFDYEFDPSDLEEKARGAGLESEDWCDCPQCGNQIYLGITADIEVEAEETED